MNRYLDRRANPITESLAGKRVVGIDVSQEERALRFRCEDGSVVVWDTDGDCCSESWWADGYGLNTLRGGRWAYAVESVAAVELPHHANDGRTRQEVDEVYGFAVTTAGGTTTFAFRNSSNGYYGGEAFVGKDEGFEWREIDGNDWQA